ncbi:3'5' cyclic nucleotide phosphodiesterase [Reticulomyxa filosa]|uniref:Phosphodiesterase n=1 Tax=Reticulomyxa filosa TaxID=46433 RepID=X6NE11_RETFI|nr:3'5' cyclic nucleotide phosphodiesterase [Reticulomyxa filosa]|eukprot:ETO24128.1 3'5' cyclic nucleotide phosphodiesterase [Reticulomyxa filosa]
MYDIDVCKEQCLVLATHHILMQLDMVRSLDISHRKLWNFLRDVEMNYNNIPYHNKLHALDVTNTLFFVLKSEFMQNHLSKLDQMAAIIAACVHDLGHDGYNNAFHMSSGSDIALTYNDSSVLENYHISRAFFLLKKSNNNWYHKLSRPIQNYFRNVIIQLVLATDMHFHFQELARLRAMLAAFKVMRGEGPFLTKKKKKSYEMYIKMTSLCLQTRDKIENEQCPVEWRQIEYNPFSRNQIGRLPHFPGLFFFNHPFGKVKGKLQLGSHWLYCFFFIKKKKNFIKNTYTYKYIYLFIFICTEIAIKNEELTSVLIPEKQVETESSRVNGVEDERLFILGAAIHICDVSNPTKELKACTQWADRIMQEFFNQGDKEKALGLPVSPMMDKETASLASGQIGFIRFIVAPIFEVFCDIIPELKPWSQVMQLNLEHWETTHKQQKNVRTQKRISKSKLEMQSQSSNNANSGSSTPTPTLGSSSQLSNGSTDNNKFKKDIKKTNVPERSQEILNQKLKQK